MASDSLGLNRLQKFASGIPDENQTNTFLRQLEQREHLKQREHDDSGDRTAAILGSTIVENALRVALLARFRPDGKRHEKIFEGEEGPLSNFAARIKVAYALRIFGPKTHRDMRCIKAVRNAFAHSLMAMDFTTPEIATVCENMTSYGRVPIAAGGGATNAKEKYIRTTCYIAGGLKRIALLTPQDVLKHAHHVWPAKTELW
jgi:hypothetical protein